MVYQISVATDLQIVSIERECHHDGKDPRQPVVLSLAAIVVVVDPQGVLTL